MDNSISKASSVQTALSRLERSRQSEESASAEFGLAIPTNTAIVVADAHASSVVDVFPRADETVALVALGRIHVNPLLSRYSYSDEELEEMAASIREHGVIQPIILRPKTGYSHFDFEVVAGGRRFFGSQMAGLSEIPAIVRELSDVDAAALSLIENLQRLDLSPVNMALKLDALRKAMQAALSDYLGQLTELQSVKRGRTAAVVKAMSEETYGLALRRFPLPAGWMRTIVARAWQTKDRAEVTDKDIAEKVGLSVGTIRNRFLLLRLNEEVREKLRARSLTEVEARLLLKLESLPEAQKRVAREIARRRNAGKPMSEPQVAALVARARGGVPALGTGDTTSGGSRTSPEGEGEVWEGIVVDEPHGFSVAGAHALSDVLAKSQDLVKAAVLQMRLDLDNVPESLRVDYLRDELRPALLAVRRESTRMVVLIDTAVREAEAVASLSALDAREREEENRELDIELERIAA